MHHIFKLLIKRSFFLFLPFQCFVKIFQEFDVFFLFFWQNKDRDFRNNCSPFEAFSPDICRFNNITQQKLPIAVTWLLHSILKLLLLEDKHWIRQDTNLNE